MLEIASKINTELDSVFGVEFSVEVRESELVYMSLKDIGLEDSETGEVITDTTIVKFGNSFGVPTVVNGDYNIDLLRASGVLSNAELAKLGEFLT